MRASLPVASCLAALLVGGRARADDKAACLDGASRGQTLRDAHQLVEAREQFRICARARCPAVVQRDCATWLAAVERSLPTVVVSAKDSAGNDVVKVTLSVDGKLLLAALDGRARPMDPGLHTFRFATPDGTVLERQVVVKEGETDQLVSVVVKKAPSATPAVAGAATAPQPAPEQPRPGRASSLRTVGFVVGGLGVVALGVGAVAGGLAIADKNSANCDANGFCDPPPLADARTAATLSTVAFVAGGVFVATGLALVLFAPKSHRASVVAYPSFDPRGPGLLLRGIF